MIAFSNESAERTEREDNYALRRILVGRLQRSSRGVSRRARMEQLRRFSDEWKTYLEEGRLDLLRRALAVGPAVALDAGDLWRRSFLLDLAVRMDGPGGERLGASSTVCVDQEVAVAEAPVVSSARESDRKRGPQGDLFGADLVAAPV